MTSGLLACAIVTVVIVATFLPFVPGGHDPLAVPLSAMAWALGRVGLLLVPVGGLWLWASDEAGVAPCATSLAGAGHARRVRPHRAW